MRGQFTYFPVAGVARPGPAAGEISKLSPHSPAPTLPRRLHRAVVRLLLPAEAAARRLIVIAARNVVVELPTPRPRKPDLKAAHAALRSLGIAVVVPAGGAIPRAPATRPGRHARPLLLPLLDPLKRFGPRRKYVPPHAAPRILFPFSDVAPHRLPSPPAPWDRIDATRLAMRIAALSRALDDLPAQARRLARWRARRDRAVTARKTHRLSPLRPGRACGGRGPRSRRPVHEVDDVLADMHHFALHTLNYPDTS